LLVSVEIPSKLDAGDASCKPIFVAERQLFTAGEKLWRDHLSKATPQAVLDAHTTVQRLSCGPHCRSAVVPSAGVHAQAGTASRQVAQLHNALTTDRHQARRAIEAHAFECTSLNKGTCGRFTAFHALSLND
jgi:hypothetical protein